MIGDEYFKQFLTDLSQLLKDLQCINYRKMMRVMIKTKLKIINVNAVHN
jgi:hypothetical protein